MGRMDKRSHHLHICVFVSLCILGYNLWPQGSTAKHAMEYGLMLDAGSTGSRIHVYSFDAKSGKLLDEIFKEVKPGLSAYKDPKEAAESLKPLMEAAVKTVPASLRKCTLVALKATAGLRRLGVDQAERHLAAVREYLGQYPFHMEKDAVEIMAGSDEGVFAWITVNQLLGRFNEGAGKTVSIMDLGGGSTQIVFEPSASSLALAPSTQRYTLKMGSKTYELYQNSYEGYGLNRAREQMYEVAAENADPSSPVQHPCVPTGHQEVMQLNGQQYTFIPRPEPSFEACYTYAKQILNKDKECPLKPCSFNGVFQPHISDPQVFSSDMYAFSYFYDRTQLGAPQPELTVADFQERAAKACTAPGTDADKKTHCADLSFMRALLAHGYSLKDSQKLKIAKKIDGFETAWALGAMVTLMKNVKISCS